MNEHLRELDLVQAASDIRIDLLTLNTTEKDGPIHYTEVLQAAVRSLVTIAMHYANYDRDVCVLVKALRNFALHDDGEARGELEALISDILDN